MPGVHAVLTGDEYQKDGLGSLPTMAPYKRRDGGPMYLPDRPAIAVGRAMHIGYPVAEISDTAGVTITKPAGTGGRVDVETVSEQLLYEIGDPAHYLTPDIDTDFTRVKLTQAGPDRVSVHGAGGNAAPEKLKVSVAYQDGYLVSSTLTVCGPRAVETARSAGARRR